MTEGTVIIDPMPVMVEWLPGDDDRSPVSDPFRGGGRPPIFRGSMPARPVAAGRFQVIVHRSFGRGDRRAVIIDRMPVMVEWLPGDR